MSPEWKAILSLRSTKDKIAVAIDCDLAPAGSLVTVAELVNQGLMTWIDRCTLGHIAVTRPDGKPVMDGKGRIRRPNVDVYQLTAKGMALCDAEGIKGS